jgi:large repetitive protein
MIIESGITIGSGINFTGAVSPIVTSGLQFNLDVAPSSGTTWTDSSGNGRDATLQGSASYTSANNGGIKLNNSTNAGTDYISVPYNISSNTVTVEIVASFNSTSHWATIWGNESYTAGRGYLAFMTSATNLIYGKSSAPTTETITASNSVRHWTFVINGTQHSLYLNGTQVGTTDTLAVQTLFVTSEFYFGSRHSNAGTGTADKMNNSNVALQPVFYQMRLYNRALSGSEITQNYNAIRGTYGI